MPYNFAAESFHTKKLYAIVEEKRPICVFEPPLGELGAT